MIAHYLRPVYPNTRSQLSLEDQYYYFDRAINVVEECENSYISESQPAQAQDH